MEDMNVVVHVGHLTRDCELMRTADDFPIVTFSMALNLRRKKDGVWIDETSFFDYKAFGSLAENLEKYLKKGTRVGVRGKSKQERWESAEGKRSSRVWVYCDQIQLLGDRKPVDGNRRVDDDGVPF